MQSGDSSTARREEAIWTKLMRNFNKQEHAVEVVESHTEVLIVFDSQVKQFWGRSLMSAVGLLEQDVLPLNDT